MFNKATIKEVIMPHVKIGPKHQITIPKEIFEELQLEVGDLLEVSVENGKVVITPKRVIDKLPVRKLSPKEQKLLKSAKK
jgi:AbrB family looped-hinge helix DNA binding protein